MKMKKMESFGLTDVGLKRSNNEDVFHIDPGKRFFLVADGMGGAAAGELASGIFKESVQEIFCNLTDRFEFSSAELVKTAFQSANQRIQEHIRKYPKHKGMGCTAELLILDDNRLILGHIGDSRTYRFREGSFKQVTRDHSLVQEKIERGHITAEEARKHPLRNVILKAVGNCESCEPDIIQIKPKDQDLFLMCSDGLTDMVDDGQICDVLAIETGLDKKIEKLVELAKSAGGFDNITVVLCRWVG